MNVYANFNLVKYTVTLQESPAAAANGWGACVAFTEINGTAIGQGTCAGPSQNGGSGATYTVSVPAGTTITYLCTADWQGGAYTWLDWSGGVSSSNGCFNPSTVVNSAMTIYANYNCQPSDVYYYFFGGVNGQYGCSGFDSTDGHSLSGVTSISSIDVTAYASSGADQNGYTRGGASSDVQLNGNDYSSSCTNNYQGNGGSSQCQSGLQTSSFYQSGGSWYAGSLTTGVSGDSYGNNGGSYSNVYIGSTSGSFSVRASANPGDSGQDCGSDGDINGEFVYSTNGC